MKKQYTKEQIIDARIEGNIIGGLIGILFGLALSGIMSIFMEIDWACAFFFGTIGLWFFIKNLGNVKK